MGHRPGDRAKERGFRDFAEPGSRRTQRHQSVLFERRHVFNAGLTIEPSTGALWVTDPGNNRVLRFPASQLAANTTLPQADLVIGQSNFTTQQVPTPPPGGVQSALVYTSLYEPAGIVFEPRTSSTSPTACRANSTASCGSSRWLIRHRHGGVPHSWPGCSTSRVRPRRPPIPNQYALLGPLGIAVILERQSVGLRHRQEPHRRIRPS